MSTGSTLLIGKDSNFGAVLTTTDMTRVDSVREQYGR